MFLESTSKRHVQILLRPTHIHPAAYLLLPFAIKTVFNQYKYFDIIYFDI